MIAEANRPNVLLKRLQGCLVGNDAGSDVENVASSFWREFDGSCMVHAGGAGGCGHADGIDWTVARDPHPATTSKASPQAVIFSVRIRQFLGRFLVQVRQGLLGVLLFGQGLTHLLGSGIGDRRQIRLVGGALVRGLCLGLGHLSE